MVSDVLVPTDGSAGSEAAIDRAIDEANAHGAALHTLYVVERGSVSAALDQGAVLDHLQEAGHRAIEEAIARARAAEVETIEGSVAEGVPHRAILQYAEANDVDLIVMGSHGKTGLERYMLGSVTEKVVRLSDVPVLTVPLPEEEEEGEEEEEEGEEESLEW